MMEIFSSPLWIVYGGAILIMAVCIAIVKNEDRKQHSAS